MYYILFHFESGLNYNTIHSLDDIKLKEVIDDLKSYSPHDVGLFHTLEQAKEFENLMTSISSTYFNGDLNLALIEFQNYLVVNNLDMILCLEDILDMPFGARLKAMDQLIEIFNELSRMFQAILLKRYNSGIVGPFP